MASKTCRKGNTVADLPLAALQDAFRVMSTLEWDGSAIHALYEGHAITLVGADDDSLKVYASIFQREQDNVVSTPFSMRFEVLLNTWPLFLQGILEGVKQVRDAPPPNVL
jgi:hypothetical protein